MRRVSNRVNRRVCRSVPGSARVPRAGFGVSPEQSLQKSPRRRDAWATLCFPANSATFLAVESYDVAIIGGGPAGSTAATLAQQSRAARRSCSNATSFPRFHIGESLLPFSMHTFTRLGLQEKLRAGFLEKFGGEIAEAGGEKAAKFYFKDGFGSRTDRSYQVTRSEIRQDVARSRGGIGRGSARRNSGRERSISTRRRDALATEGRAFACPTRRAEARLSENFGRVMSLTRAGAIPSSARSSS